LSTRAGPAGCYGAVRSMGIRDARRADPGVEMSGPSRRVKSRLMDLITVFIPASALRLAAGRIPRRVL
jgi:hypothetical protein